MVKERGKLPSVDYQKVVEEVCAGTERAYERSGAERWLVDSEALKYIADNYPKDGFGVDTREQGLNESLRIPDSVVQQSSYLEEAVPRHPKSIQSELLFMASTLDKDQEEGLKKMIKIIDAVRPEGEKDIKKVMVDAYVARMFPRVDQANIRKDLTDVMEFLCVYRVEKDNVWKSLPKDHDYMLNNYELALTADVLDGESKYSRSLLQAGVYVLMSFVSSNDLSEANQFMANVRAWKKGELVDKKTEVSPNNTRSWSTRDPERNVVEQVLTDADVQGTLKPEDPFAGAAEESSGLFSGDGSSSRKTSGDDWIDKLKDDEPEPKFTPVPMSKLRGVQVESRDRRPDIFDDDEEFGEEESTRETEEQELPDWFKSISEPEEFASKTTSTPAPEMTKMESGVSEKRKSENSLKRKIGFEVNPIDNQVTVDLSELDEEFIRENASVGELKTYCDFSQTLKDLQMIVTVKNSPTWNAEMTAEFEFSVGSSQIGSYTENDQLEVFLDTLSKDNELRGWQFKNMLDQGTMPNIRAVSPQGKSFQVMISENSTTVFLGNFDDRGAEEKIGFDESKADLVTLLNKVGSLVYREKVKRVDENEWVFANNSLKDLWPKLIKVTHNNQGKVRLRINQREGVHAKISNFITTKNIRLITSDNVSLEVQGEGEKKYTVEVKYGKKWGESYLGYQVTVSNNDYTNEFNQAVEKLRVAGWTITGDNRKSIAIPPKHLGYEDALELGENLRTMVVSAKSFSNVNQLTLILEAVSVMINKEVRPEEKEVVIKDGDAENIFFQMKENLPEQGKTTFKLGINQFNTVFYHLLQDEMRRTRFGNNEMELSDPSLSITSNDKLTFLGKIGYIAGLHLRSKFGIGFVMQNKSGLLTYKDESLKVMGGGFIGRKTREGIKKLFTAEKDHFSRSFIQKFLENINGMMHDEIGKTDDGEHKTDRISLKVEEDGVKIEVKTSKKNQPTSENKKIVRDLPDDFWDDL